MGKSQQQEEPYDEGLAPPPELPALAKSQAGAVEQAETLQQQNDVPEKYRLAWYHGTYDNFDALDNQHAEWTWFTRSPAGGTLWGHSVLVVYLFANPENTKLHATSNKGDKDGYEGDHALPEWWMSVGREDIPKLMVVDKFHQKNDEAKLKALQETEGYKTTRRACIEKLPAAKNGPED